MGFDPRGKELIVGPPIDDPRFDLEDWRDKALDRLWRVLNGEWDDSPENLLLIGGALHDRKVRDVVAFDITWSDDDQQPRFVEFWSKVTRTLRPDDAAPALSILACSAWMNYDLALMRSALTMMQATPDRHVHQVSLVQLMIVAMNIGCERETWLRAMAGVTRNDCRWGRGGLRV